LREFSNHTHSRVFFFSLSEVPLLFPSGFSPPPYSSTIVSLEKKAHEQVPRILNLPPLENGFPFLPFCGVFFFGVAFLFPSAGHADGGTCLVTICPPLKPPPLLR